MEFYSTAAMERGKKIQESDLVGSGQENYLVAGSGDYRHQRSAYAALAGVL